MKPSCARLGWLAVFLAAGSAPGPAADWPRFRGPDGTGFSAEKLTLLPQPKKLWQAEVGNGCASLAIQDGRLYTVGSVPQRGTHLYCLDATTGEELWKRATHCWYQVSTPTVAAGRVYVLSTPENRPVATCHDARTGEVVWRKEWPKPDPIREYGHAGSPLLWEDLVILNLGTGVALKRDTGEVAWQHEGKAGLATPVLYAEKGQPRVLLFAGEALIARDARSGRELWSIPWKTEIAVNACDPIYHEGKVFLSTTYGKHAALFDVAAGRPRMLWQAPGSSFSSGFLRQGHLYCFMEGRFCCLDFATGERQWAVPGVGSGSALLADDTILLLSERGELSIARLSAASFTPILRHAVLGGTNWTPPALVDGKLYVRNKAGRVVCVHLAGDKEKR